MKPHPLKWALSFFREIPVEHISSDFSGQLEVSLHKGEWKLSTENAVYSFGKRYTSYALAFRKLYSKIQSVESVLVLGCGIGSVARLLENHANLRHITAIDIDPAMITLAKKYWSELLLDKTIFICDDAEEWVRNTNEIQYDLIIADLFIDDVTPSVFESSSFLTALKKLFSNKGLLLFSRIHYSQAQQQKNKEFEKTFKSVFQNGYALPVGFNLMMVGQGS